MVRVPNDLSGASLLGVHNWVKGNIALSNPGASPDYTITDASGNRMSLSDVSRSAGRNVNIEVTTVSGIKKNPAMNLTMIPGFDAEYPNMVRTGNNLTDLLPGEIDSAMATRIVAEQGLHRGLHTLNRMTLTTYNKSISSPTTAALLQMGEIIKTNPSDRTPFSQRTPIHYGSEKALESYMLELSGADKIDLDSEQSALTAVEDAKIASKYGLNVKDISHFSQNVLSDYLFAASSNRGLIRTLIRNVPMLRDKRNASKSRELIAKLTYMFPTQPQSFYDGSQRVFVAHPAFMYPVYAESVLSGKQMKALVKFADGYPRNMGTKDIVPNNIRKMVRRVRGQSIYSILRQFVTLTPFSLPDSSDAVDAHAATEGHLVTVAHRLTRDPRRDLRNRNFRPLNYFSDLGGFYPSPPPKWPRKLMYAIMDGFLENLPHIIDTTHPSRSQNLSPVQMAYFTEPIDIKGLINVQVVNRGGKGKKVHQINLNDLLLDIEEVEAAIASADKRVKEALALKWKGKYQGNHVVANAPKELENMRDEMVKAKNKAMNTANENLTKTEVLTFDAGGPKSILEMVYDIAEIASSKYDYNMRGDDFKFTMAMVHYSFEALMEETHGSAFSLISDRVNRGLDNLLGANKSKRLDELIASIPEAGMERGAQNAFMQKAFVAKLMLIRDQIEDDIQSRRSLDGRQQARNAGKAEYLRLVEGLKPNMLSSGMNFAVQSVLADIRNIVEEVER